MTITFKNAVNTLALAVTLACAGASHAADTYKHDAINGGQVYDEEMTFFKPGIAPVLDVALYEMTNAQTPSQQFLAFCIAPAVDTYSDTIYTAHYNASVSYEVKALYETAFHNIQRDSEGDQLAAFQLALWELNNDDGKLLATTGKQYFSSLSPAAVQGAQDLLNGIVNYKVQGLYSYTTFTGLRADGVTIAQDMLGVSAVPETETWAMALVGLGLIGAMVRRQSKSDRDDKFAA